MEDGAVIRRAEASDVGATMELLAASALPTLGVAESLDGFFVAEEAGGIVGVVGLEVHGRDGVLRSVAVTPAARGRGLGGRLTERALESARRVGLRRVYLLTTTAADYFPRYGFRRIRREDASPAVRASVEFSEACPDSAVAMVLEVEEG